MTFSHPINLPGPIMLLASTEVGLGLYLIFFNNPPFSFTKKEILVPAPRTLRIADTTRLLGITILALGTRYFMASYTPLEENQFVHCSVPIRLGISGLIFTLLAVKGRRGMSEEGF
ncbi:hypothetical protein AOQ84DRAFT_355746 [Glonium stellatum]|uniref:Uncharacterized protein n=1 Tax=Glonium stellatum TaxID=574774 RepID=A0A8E2JQL3_9PEZI|nr:hypothetical protein AOQ84DRAFT_355746 [Glonium stellatum]